MLHRYRAAMVRPRRDRLAGHVEVDEGYVGGVESTAQGRKTESKAIVAIAVEIKHPKGFGRIRLKHVPDVSAESLLPIIDEAAEPGATIHTDGWQAYWNLGDRGYEHERTVMRRQNDPAHVVMPGVHRVASLLQRWLLGAHQGRVSHDHLDAYLKRVHLPLPPPQLAGSRLTALPPARASRHRRPDHLPQPRRQPDPHRPSISAPNQTRSRGRRSGGPSPEAPEPRKHWAP